MSDGPTPEERLQLQTVNHKVRTAVVFGVIGGIILAICMYLGFK